ncbi:MAG: DUF2110 family protein [Methanolobus sp.]
MVIVKLLLKIYGNKQRATHSAEVLVNNELTELEASAEFSISDDNWLTANVTGEDEEFAANFLVQKFGTPVTEPVNGEVYTGVIRQIYEKEIIVDIGIPIIIPQKNLTVLGSGTAKQIATRFGMLRHLPVKIEITDVESKAGNLSKRAG